MIKFIDFLSHSSSHINFNSCVLEYCDLTDIHLAGETEHINFIQDRTDKITQSKPYTRGRFWKVMRDVYFLKEVIDFNRFKVINREENLIVILGATGTQMFLLSLFLKLMKNRRKDIRLFFHSELEFFDGKKGINKTFAKMAVKHLKLSKMIKTAVLSSHIKDNLTNISAEYNSICLVRHPMPDSFDIGTMKAVGECIKTTDKLNISVIGLLRGDTKDLALPVKLRQFDQVNVRFFGRRGPNSDNLILSPECRVVETHYINEWLETCLSDTDFLLIVPLKNSYKFTALGTVSDSVSFSKPLTWMSHPALADFEDYPLSCVFETIEDFVSTVHNYEYPDVLEVNEWIRIWNNKSKSELNSFIAGKSL
jgi:hypothetical protein